MLSPTQAGTSKIQPRVEWKSMESTLSPTSTMIVEARFVAILKHCQGRGLHDPTNGITIVELSLFGCMTTEELAEKLAYTASALPFSSPAETTALTMVLAGLNLGPQSSENELLLGRLVKEGRRSNLELHEVIENHHDGARTLAESFDRAMELRPARRSHNPPQ